MLPGSVARSYPTLRTHGLQHARLPCPSATPGAYSNSMSIESVMPSDHLILCHPFSSRPQSFAASGSFSIESALRIRWPEYWSFSFSISPSKEYSGLISFGFCGIRDLNSSTRGQTHVLCIARWILNHWTTREIFKLKIFR